MDENIADKDYGGYVGDIRPALAVSSPRPGVADADSGLKPGTLSIMASNPPPLALYMPAHTSPLGALASERTLSTVSPQ